MSIQPTMLASIIGALGNSRLPEDSKVQMVPLVPDRKDSPVGAYVKSPSLRSDWKNAQVKKRALLKDFLDLGSPEGRVLTTAYPDIGEIPIEITKESSTSYYFPRRQVGNQVFPETIKLSARALNNPKQTWTGIIHEALSHGVAAREKWGKDFRGTSPEAMGNDYLKYLYNPGERIAQAHVLYESAPHLQENYSFPELAKALAGYRGENPTPRSLPMEKPTVTSRSAGGTDSLIQEARRFLSELQTPSSRFMKQFDPETGWIYSGSRETQQAAKAGDTEVPNVPTEEPVPQATGSAPEPGKNPYREMTIAQKLNLADELLKQYEGTDKYDAFKERVDAMKHKYGEIARVAPDAKWNYDEASQTDGQKGLPGPQPNVQIEGSSVNPNYDSTITKRQNYLDWYSKRGWGSKFVSKLTGQDKQLADTAERAKADIAYLKGMKNALGYAMANPERARALGALVTPRRFFEDGSPWSYPRSFVWNEDLGQFTVVPSGVKVKSREPMQEAQQDAKGGDTHTGTQQASKAGDSPRRADLSNFLATDEVPETLFGIPIVANPEQYTEADIAFFKEHPRAGGFYELGDEDADTQAATGAEGTSEELPRYYKVQPGDNLSKISKATGVPYANIAKYSKLADPNKIRVGQVLLLTEPYPGKWNNPGNVRWNRKVVREGETGKVKSKVSDGYFLTFDTPQNGLNAQAQVIGAIARSTIPERYQKGELPNSKFTISNLINVYAPPNDKNDTSGYIKFVADELGVDKDAELNIDDAKQMSSLLRAIVTRDSKSEYAEWFRDSEYAEAVKKMKTPVKGREEPGKKGK